MDSTCPRCQASMVCEPASGCWCADLPLLSPVPAEADTKCLCATCLRETQMLAGRAVIQAQLDQLDAEVKAAARPEQPPDAKPGEWLCGQVDYVEHPGGYREATGPQMWTPKHLSLTRVMLMRDLGRAH